MHARAADGIGVAENDHKKSEKCLSASSIQEPDTKMTEAEACSSAKEVTPAVKKETREIGYEIEARKGTIEVRLEKLDAEQLLPPTTTTTTKKEGEAPVTPTVEEERKSEKSGKKSAIRKDLGASLGGEDRRKDDPTSSQRVGGGHEDAKRSPKRKNSGGGDEAKAKKGKKEANDEDPGSASATKSKGKKADKMKRKTEDGRAGATAPSTGATDAGAAPGSARKKLKLGTKDAGTLKEGTVGQNSQEYRLEYWATRSSVRSFARGTVDY